MKLIEMVEHQLLLLPIEHKKAGTRPEIRKCREEMISIGTAIQSNNQICQSQ